jgi:toxin-antitoxin system PIN domain toxin
MKSYLVDTNVWIALAYDQHEHHATAIRWFEQASAGESCFCRITQLALLRLLTNAKVMGRDVRTDKEAWKDYDEFAKDVRVDFVEDGPGLDAALRSLTMSGQSSHRLWPDAYLGALSIVTGMQVVSFDAVFRTMPGVDAVVLTQAR